MKKQVKRYYFISFIVNFILAALSISYFMLKDGGLFTLNTDFNMQQLPFSMLCNEAIKSGDVFWNWNIDLGSNFIAAMSFSLLGSPFFWLTMPFSAEMFPYLMGPVLMLKYGVAGVTSYAYLQRFTDNKKYAVLASMLYTFSGFQSANIAYYNFHDVVAFFPLLLIGLEKVMKEKKYGCIAFSAFLNAFLNYYFFIGEVVFLVIYYFFRFFLPELSREQVGKSGVKKVIILQVGQIGLCLWEGILGVMMAALLFVPSVYAILNNSRATEWIQAMKGLSFETWEYLRILEGFFFPAESINQLSCITNNDYSNGAAYLPMVGMLLVIVYVYHHFQKRSGDWLERILITLGLFALIPILNSSFYMLNQSGYRRWYYMITLMMALASMQVLEKRAEYSIKRPAVMTFGIMGSFLVYLVMIPKLLKQDILVDRPLVFSAILGLGFWGVTFSVFCLKKIKKEKLLFNILALGVALFCVGTTFLDIFLYRSSYEMTAKQVYEDTVVSVRGLEQDVMAGRYVFTDELDNYKNKLMTVSRPCLRSFCSTVCESIVTFYRSMGISRSVTSRQGPIGTEELLSVKYYISYLDPEGMSQNKKDDDSRELVQTLSNDSYSYYVYEDRNALPFGFTHDCYMTYEQYWLLPESRKALGMLAALVVENDADIQTISQVLPQISEEEYQRLAGTGDFDIAMMSEEEKAAEEVYLKQMLVERRHKEASESFTRTSDSFQAEIIAQNASYVYFSVPFDKGWSAFVNGQATEIMSVNGMMSVPITAGRNEVVFTYQVPGLKEGMILTVVGWLLFLIYVTITAVSSIKRQKTAQV